MLTFDFVTYTYFMNVDFSTLVSPALSSILDKSSKNGN